MTFVTPWLLAGAGLVALPIILHLIMRRKPKLFEFPALRFIEKRHDTNQRRLRLRHILLLLLRAAAIALLAFSLARPSVQFGHTSLGSQEAPVAAALIFDAAPRMQYRHENRTRIEAARELGLWLLAQLPSESQIAVLDTRLAPAAFSADRGSAKQRIQQLETVANSQPLTVVVEEAAKLLAKTDPGRQELERKEIYVFTDLARGAWPREAAARLQEKLGDLPGVAIYVIDVGVERPSNYWLGEVRLSSQVLSNRSSLAISCDLSRAAGESPSNAEQRSVELYLLDENRQPQKQGEERRAVAAGDTQQFDFRHSNLPIGTHQGYLRIVGQDGLEADDTRYFTVSVRPAWRILLAATTPEKAQYLSEALAPEAFRKRRQARFECETITLGELAKHELGPYSAVCLLDPTPLEPAVWQKLGNFVAEGRGLGVFLGRNARTSEPFNAAEAQELLPGKLGFEVGHPDGDYYLAPHDYEHPVLAPFRRLASSIPWNAFPVFRFWTFDESPSGVSVVLRLNDQSPILFERSVGAGRVLTLATPISDRADARAWNLLPVGVIDNAGPFVMLANQLVAYLVGASDEQLNYLCGQTAVLLLDPKNQRRNYVLTGPEGLSLPLSADAKTQRLSISATDQPGNYRVQGGGTTDGVDLGFSANLAPQQTELERLPAAQLRDVFGAFPYRMAHSRAEIDRDISVGRVGRELFTPAILVVVVVLALELVIANRFYRQ